jgi:predicted peroxiredoxin
VKIAVILRKPPYGDINAAEAVRHAMGAQSDDIPVSLILLDGGVLLAKKGHDMALTGFTNLGDALKDCIDMGIGVYADKASLKECSLETAEMIEGVKAVNGSEIAELVKESKTMVF